MHLRAILGKTIKDAIEAHARHQIKRHPVLTSLTASVQGSTGASFADYWMLYAYIKKHKPKEVLELGPGVTTLIIAQALHENGGGRVTAMEDIPEYYEATRRSIPRELEQYIDIRLSPRQEKRYGPFVGVGYENIPLRPYTFVWIDGPTYDAETSFNADILEVVQHSEQPLTAYVDSRTGSCFIYHLVFGRKFAFSYIRRVGIISKVSAANLRSYPRIVSSAMRDHRFKRAWQV